MGQLGTDHGAGGPETGTGIGRAADDGKRLGGADINRADLKAVGVGMPLGGQYFSHHNLAEGRRDRFDGLNL